MEDNSSPANSRLRCVSQCPGSHQSGEAPDRVPVILCTGIQSQVLEPTTEAHPVSHAIAVIQARMTSTRLPGKVLRDLGGTPVLGWVVRAARDSGVLDRVVVATSVDGTDDVVADAARALGADVIRGPLDDVLDRFILAVDAFAPEAVVRLTADCPLLDPAIIAMVVRAFDPKDLDYMSTGIERSLPRGLDVEVCSAEALRVAAAHATGADRSHVTSYLYREPSRFRVAGLVFEPRAGHHRVTLDTVEDAAVIDAIVDEIGNRAPSWHEVIALLDRRPDIVAFNAHVEQKPLDDG